MKFQIFQRSNLIGNENVTIFQNEGTTYLSIESQYTTFISRTYIEFDKNSNCLIRYNKSISGKFYDYYYNYIGIDYCSGVLNINNLFESDMIIVALELLYYCPNIMYEICNEYQCIDLYNGELLQYNIISSKDSIYNVVGLSKIVCLCKNKLSEEVIMPNLRFKI